MSTIIEHIIIGIRLNQMNAEGKHAVIVPPCSDLPSLVHTRDGEIKRYKGNTTSMPRAKTHPWAKFVS